MFGMKSVTKAFLAGSLAVALALAAPALAQTSGGGADQPAAAVETAQPAASTPPESSGASQAGAAAEPAPRAIIPAAAIPRDLSPWSMFMSADILVKAVMIGLAFASLITWTIFLAKTIELFIARRRVRQALSEVEASGSLAQAHTRLKGEDSLVGEFIAAAANEMHLSRGTLMDPVGVKERAATSFAEITRSEARAIRRGMGALATIGATAPFIGLFGTVWGIMNSFIGISKSQTTNLAVVAPGIAEALLATAIGLVAAIPAVIIYNHFSRATRGYLDLVGRASGAVARLLSRDLDRAGSGMISRAAE